jgi:hypothetical protein
MTESTLSRNLEKLLKNGDILKENSGKNTFYSLAGIQRVQQHLKKDFFSRPKVAYNPDFLKNYTPNITSFL